ncbi:hypothetical protein MTO96_051618, partial [Rhipicephalus appendiculatus]
RHSNSRPDIFFDEAVAEHVVPALTQLDSIFSALGEENDQSRKICHYIMRVKLDITVTCLMNYQNFPMDTHTCDLSLRSYAYPAHILWFHWFKVIAFVKDERVRMKEYHVAISKTKYMPSSSDYGGRRFVGVRLQFRFRRRIQRHLVDTFVPTAFLVALSWISFWLGTSLTQPRVYLCGIVLLAVLQHLTAAREALAPSRTCTGLDIWTILCLTFVSGSIVEVTFVCYCSRVLHTGNLTVRLSRVRLRARPSRGSNSEEPETTSSIAHLRSEVSLLGPAGRVDKFCRYAFPLTFFILNITFWSWIYNNQVADQRS